MTEWLLSGHNTQETTGVARPVTVTMTSAGLDAQIDRFLGELAGDTSDFDFSLRPTAVVQGRLYLNIDYYVRNMGLVVPFDPESVGAPVDLVTSDQKPPLKRSLALPGRFRRVYRWATHFYREELPALDAELRELHWVLRDGPEEPLPLIQRLFDPEFYARSRQTDRAHIVIALTITSLDGVLRQRAPELLGLFVGQETTTSLIGQRIWELRELAEQCGPEVTEKLRAGVVDLEVYRALPAAAPLVVAVEAFLHEYGHRGFRYEADFETERLADRPEHVLMTVAGQLAETRSPQARAEAAREMALQALRKMNPLKRALWRRVLGWGQRLISWREDSKSNIALRQAVYGQAARLLARHFYPERTDDWLMFYTLDEFIAFVRSGGEARVAERILEHRRADFELHQTQIAPPELIWYDPETRHWRPARKAQPGGDETEWRFQGIPASAGEGVVEGLAVVTNDPFEAARRLLATSGVVILVTRLTDPAWSSLFAGLAGVVTELGGVISHAAIVARENGLPAVVGIPEITQKIHDGQRVRVNGKTGVVEVLT